MYSSTTHRTISSLLASAVWLLATCFAAGSGTLAHAQSYDVDAISRAAVQVLVDDGSGSGTLLIVDDEALVFTNRHVVEGFDEATIAVLVDVNAPAEPRFKATLKGFSEAYDFAVLKLTTDMDGNPVSISQLRTGHFDGFTVPDIPLHDGEDKTNNVRRGDNIALFGYPGIGDNELVYTTGIVSSVQMGEYDDQRLPMWYRTNAEMSPGNSGGMALNARGEFIGIPTSVRTEYETGGRLGNLLAVPLVMAVLRDNALTTSWADVQSGKLDFLQSPTYGSVTLDSVTIAEFSTTQMLSGGGIDVSYLGDSCTGYASSNPDLRVHLQDPVTDLSIIFEAIDIDEDTTLIINTPDGKWHCNDDMDIAESLDPGLWFENADAGQYDIWVGSYYDEDLVDGYLTVYQGELASFEDMMFGGDDGLDWTQDTYSGETSLEAGFTPDPHVVELVAGGSVDVAAGEYGDSCTGYASSAPDYRLHWSGKSDTLRILFEAEESGEDTVLIVSTPDTSWLCNDDGHTELNPLVEIRNPEEGQYDIWVGTYQSGEYIGGELKITELSATR